jgi:hypothetical protein
LQTFFELLWQSLAVRILSSPKLFRGLYKESFVARNLVEDVDVDTVVAKPRTLECVIHQECGFGLGHVKSAFRGYRHAILRIAIRMILRPGINVVLNSIRRGYGACT